MQHLDMPCAEMLNRPECEPLTREEEEKVARALPRRWARDALVTHNLRFCFQISQEYEHQGVELDELFAWGRMGLIRATEKFDPDRGNTFITYAVHWIRQYIGRELREADTVRQPVNHWKAYLRALGRQRREEQEQLRRVPLDDARRRQNAEDGVGDYGGTHLIYSGDAPIPDYADDMWDCGTGATAPTQEDDIEEREQMEMCERYLAVLGPRYRYILERRHGLHGGKPMTLEDIGRELGVTKERVRQLEAKAMARLQREAGRRAVA